jgi:hypothetical protein
MAGCLALALDASPTGFIPKNGYVPDEATAIKIAEAVLIPIYGREQIEGERPFKATLNSDVWVVTGSLQAGRVGGVAVVKISKKDARVLAVTHGK